MSGDRRQGNEDRAIERIFSNAEMQLVGPWQEQLSAAIRIEEEDITDGLGGNHETPNTTEQQIKPTGSVGWLQRPRVLVAAAAVLVVGLGIFLQLDRGTESQQVAATDDHPAAIADRFIESFNEGDREETISLFTADALVVYQDTSGSVDLLTLGPWESLLEFYAAQSAVIVDEECVDVGGGKVRCEWRLEDAVTDAAGQPGDVVVAEFTVVGPQITELDYTIDFVSEARLSFFRWVTMNRPEADEVFLWSPESTPTEGRIFGELIARYASEWAATNNASPTSTTG